MSPNRRTTRKNTNMLAIFIEEPIAVKVIPNEGSVYLRKPLSMISDYAYSLTTTILKSAMNLLNNQCIEEQGKPHVIYRFICRRFGTTCS